METVGASTFGARFDLVGEAGSGGMGTVYEAIDRSTTARVAIKVLTDAGDRERFAREVEILETLEHEAIVKYVGHGVTAAGQPFLAMQWLAGESLSKCLRRGALPLPDAVELAARLAGALAYAHAAGVIHRDLKPSNVHLLDGEVRRACLIDFGVAKVNAGDLTTTGQMIGTPGYMAPEQVRGERSVDRRADVFALGCVLYQAISAKAPFAGGDVTEVLSRLLLEQPPPLETPSRLGWLLDAMLAKDPAHRIADCAVVRDELLAIAAALRAGDTHALATRAPGIPIPPADEQSSRTFAMPAHSPPTQVERPSAKRAAPKRRLGPWIAIAVLAAMIGGAVGVVAVLHHTGEQPPEQPAPVKPVESKHCDKVDRTGCAKHCERGDPGACWLYGLAVISTDVDVALAAFERSCRLGGVFGCADAAKLLLDGDPDAQDIAAAAKHLDRGCTDGDTNACLLAGKQARPDGYWPDVSRAFRVIGLVCDDRIDDKLRVEACATLRDMIAKAEGSEAQRGRARQLLDGACKRGVATACPR